MELSDGIKVQGRPRFLFCSAFLTLIFSAYLLPTLFPCYIGTAYIVLSFAMSGLSLFAWKYEYLTPRAALYLSIAGCLCLGPLLPYSSNDTHRYLWDGAVFLSGLDPYVTAPNDPLVANLRAIWPTPEEHAQYATLYPPGALSLFALCSLAGPQYGIWVWKLMTVICVILSLSLILKLLTAKGLAKHFYLVAFCPLLLFETQIGGHLDIVSMLGIVFALWLLDKEKIILAGVIIGLVATTKFLPAVIVGPFLFFLTPRKALTLFTASAGTWFSIYLLMFGLGYKPLGLLPTFFEKWRGGAPFYPILEQIKYLIGLSKQGFLLGLISLAATGFFLAAWFAKRGAIDVALIVCLSVPLLLSPVLFPWYLLVLIPFLALRPNVTIFLAITCVPLNYVVLNKWLSQGVWDQPTWPAIVLAGVILLGLFWDLFLGSKFRLSLHGGDLL